MEVPREVGSGQRPNKIGFSETRTFFSALTSIDASKRFPSVARGASLPLENGDVPPLARDALHRGGALAAASWRSDGERLGEAEAFHDSPLLIQSTTTTTPVDPDSLRRRSFASSSSSSTAGGEESLDARLDAVNRLFSTAREDLEDAQEDEGTVHFEESYNAAYAGVRETLRAFDDVLSSLDEEKRGSVRRSMGLKMEQLKAELAALEPH